MTTVPGTRCDACGRVAVISQERCGRCAGDVVDHPVDSSGRVWSATTVHLAVAGREPPFHLAWVDLDAGPRVLATTTTSTPFTIGDPVTISPGEHGWHASKERIQ